MKRRALSLIEVVLSLVILGLAVPPLMMQLGSAIQAHGDDAVYLNMGQLASERVGEIFADRTDTTRGYTYIDAGKYPKEQTPRGLSGYERATAVVEVSPADHVTPLANSGIKRIRVEVTGPGGRSVAVETFVVRDAAGVAAQVDNGTEELDSDDKPKKDKKGPKKDPPAWGPGGKKGKGGGKK